MHINQSNTKVEIVCTKGYWDGPLTGICEYNGKRYWFESYLDYNVHYTDINETEQIDTIRTFCAIEISKFTIEYILLGKKIFNKLIHDISKGNPTSLASNIWYKFLHPIFFDIKPKGRPAFAFYWTTVSEETGNLLGEILTPRGVFSIK